MASGLAKAGVAVGVVVLGGAAWAGGDRLVQAQAQDSLQEALDRFEADAAAVDEFDVIRLAYDRDAGTVDYRFRYRPESDNPLHEPLAELQGTPEPSVSASGRMEVEDYGLARWVSGQPFRAAGTLPWAEAVAADLPALEQDHWATLEFAHRPGGDTGIHLQGTGYDGDLLMAGQHRIGELSWDAWEASAQIAGEAGLQALHAELPRAWIGVPGEMDLRIDGLRLRGDNLVIVDSLLVEGDSELALDGIEGEFDDESFRMRDLRLAGVTRETDGRSRSDLSLELGETRAEGLTGLQQFHAELHLDLDAASVREAGRLGREVEAGVHALEDVDALYQQWLMDTASHGAALELRELRVVDARGDALDGSLTLRAGEIPPAAWQGPGLLEYLSGSLQASVDRGLIRTSVREDMALREPHRPAAEVDREAEEIVAMLMQGAREFPLFTVEDDRVRLDVEVAEGMIVVDGEPMMAVTDLMMLLQG